MIPHLCVIYGAFGPHSEKVQRIIDGGSTCMYREYAERFGEIVYLTPQSNVGPFGRCLTTAKELQYHLCNLPPSAVVWAVKHDRDGRRDSILSRCLQTTVYYSCCAYHPINLVCDLSLVDTEARRAGNGALWVKGKNEQFWCEDESVHKEYDYCLIGRRGDKNEVWFVEQMTANVKTPRDILWIGGEKHAHKMPQTHHNVVCTPFNGPVAVRDDIRKCAVGVIISDIPAEGFPQAFIEMQMCGLPVVYADCGPWNELYSVYSASYRAPKDKVWLHCEAAIQNHDLCGSDKFTLENSYRMILERLGYDF